MKFYILSILCLGFYPIFNQAIPDSLKEHSNAVVLSEVTNIEYADYKSYEVTYSKKVTIFNKKARHLQTVQIHYKKGSDRIKQAKINIFSKNGELLKTIKKKEMEDYASSDGYSIITDYRVLSWTYDNNSFPITIEYSYQKKSDNTLTLPQWFPFKGYNIATLESRFKINTQETLHTLTENFEVFPTIKSSENEYVMLNQKALKLEKFGLPTHRTFPRLLCHPQSFIYEGFKGSFDNWKEYGLWMYNSFLKDKGNLCFEPK